MKKRYILLLFVLCFGILNSVLYLKYGTAFENIGSDQKLSDRIDDLWYVSTNGSEIQSIEKIDTHDYLDISNLSISEKTGYYEVKIQLRGLYNKTMLESHNDSHITAWIYVNDPIEPNKWNAPLVCTIGKNHPQGYVLATMNNKRYENNSAAAINKKVITWRFPKDNITNVLENVEEVNKWNVEAWSFCIINRTKQSIEGREAFYTEYIVDLIGNPEYEKQYNIAWTKINNREISGYMIFPFTVVLAFLIIGIVIRRSKNNN
jgi:hypothetical protein